MSFAVLGCPDIEVGSNVQVKYSSDRSTAEVTCKSGQHTWMLNCKGQQWIGYIDNNCSQLGRIFRIHNSVDGVVVFGRWRSSLQFWKWRSCVRQMAYYVIHNSADGE